MPKKHGKSNKKHKNRKYSLKNKGKGGIFSCMNKSKTPSNSDYTITRQSSADRILKAKSDFAGISNGYGEYANIENPGYLPKKYTVRAPYTSRRLAEEAKKKKPKTNRNRNRK